MPSNNSKHSPEMREQTARFILENNRSATSVAEEMGIDTNAVCRWVRDFRPGLQVARGVQAALLAGECSVKTVTRHAYGGAGTALQLSTQRILEVIGY